MRQETGRISHHCRCQELARELATVTAKVAELEATMTTRDLTIANIEVLAAACHNDLIRPVEAQLELAEDELARVEAALAGYPLMPRETFIGKESPADRVTWLVRRLMMVEVERAKDRAKEGTNDP